MNCHVTWKCINSSIHHWNGSKGDISPAVTVALNMVCPFTNVEIIITILDNQLIIQSGYMSSLTLLETYPSSGSSSSWLPVTVPTTLLPLLPKLLKFSKICKNSVCESSDVIKPTKTQLGPGHAPLMAIVCIFSTLNHQWHTYLKMQKYLQQEYDTFHSMPSLHLTKSEIHNHVIPKWRSRWFPNFCIFNPEKLDLLPS